METGCYQIEYLELLRTYLLDEGEYKRRMSMIQKARNFCDYLTSHHIDYEVCLKHQEVLGCDESSRYYQRFKDYLKEEYVICKNLLVQERKGEKRKFLVIMDSRSQLSFQQLREILDCRKLEFVGSDEMKDILDTTPGNVSLFNLIHDQERQVHLVLDEELLEANLLVFHPLYNGMSLFLKPGECMKFLDLIERSADVVSLPKENGKKYVKGKFASNSKS